MMNYVDRDDPWSVRCAHYFQRHLSTQRRKFAAAFVLACVGWFVLVGVTDVTRWLLGIDSHIDLEMSSHFRLAPNDARGYEWRAYSNLTGETVSDTVVTARAGFVHARQLVVLDDKYCDAGPNRVLHCADISALPSSSMSKEHAGYMRMQLYAYRFLSQNHQRRQCVCGPQLGQSLRYIAVYGGSKQAKSPVDDNNARLIAEFERENTAMMDTNNDAIVVHMFNVVDESARVYDELDAARLKQDGVGLQVTKENQNYRYNRSRGEFQLLRRTRLRIEFEDRMCHVQRVRVEGELAVCVQECFDLTRGIDVRERARMQYKRGVTLNRAYFDSVPDAPSCDIDAPRAPLPVVMMEIKHDEL